MPRLDTHEALLEAAIAISMHGLDKIEPRQAARRVYALAERARRRVLGDNPKALVAHLHNVLFEEEKLTGNVEDYYNPDNSYVPSVLDTGQGLPITLSLIYTTAARRLGLKAVGINAPIHFMAGVELENTLLMVDPFFRGRAVTQPEAIERLERVTQKRITNGEQIFPVATPRQWLLRMLANLKNIFWALDRRVDFGAMCELQELIREKRQ